jgi:hydroxyacylglutathione hydrolase
MKIWRTKSGYEIFRVLSGRSNSYLISAKGKNILVDTGKESAFKKLESGINSLPLTGSKLSFLILTHTHFDHLQKEYNKYKNKFRIKERLDKPAIKS